MNSLFAALIRDGVKRQLRSRKPCRRRVPRSSESPSAEQLEVRQLLSAAAIVDEPMTLLSDSPQAVTVDTLQIAEGGTSCQRQTSEFARFASTEQLRQFLIDQAVERYSGCFGRSLPPVHDTVWSQIPSEPVLFGFTTATVAELTEASGHSKTNVQVEGVDEGDLVEADGDFLYVLSGQELVIVDVRADDEPKVVSRLDVGRQLQHGNGSTDFGGWNSKLTGELPSIPPVQHHECGKGSRFFDGPQIFTQAILDELFFEDFRVGQPILVEMTIDALHRSQLGCSPPAFSGDDDPLPKRLGPSHADGTKLAFVANAVGQTVEGLF